MFDPLKTKTRILGAVLLIAATALGTASVMGWTSLSAMPAVDDRPQVSADDVRPAVELSQAFVAISETVTPAVVRIEVDRPRQTAQRGGGGGGGGGLPGFPGFPDLFGPGPEGGEQEQERQQPLQTAGGSGFIFSSDGYILTNDHVVARAEQIRVILADGREYVAEMVGSDPTTDVAVIRIDDTGLPTLSFGSSRDARVGEWVLAIGNPGFGGGSRLDYTVTAGIISAVGRPLDLLRNELQRQEGWAEDAAFAIEDFIQTDAVINPGNSGGPLVDMEGRVVGINTAIASPTGFFQGYGFAVPIDLGKRIMEDLVEYGQVRRPYLGIGMQPVSAVDQELYGLPRAAGAFVDQIQPGTPAEEAGLRQEDVIVAIDGDAVERPSQLQSLIVQKRPGDRVTLRLYRDGEAMDVQIRLGEREVGPRPNRQTAREPGAASRLGIEIGELSPEDARQLGYDEPGGVVITGVTRAGPAARADLGPGLRILEINRTPVETVEAAEEILGELEGGDIVSFRLGFPSGETTVRNLRVPR
ncbi:MAG: PDZ domain-containing protein [Gemmatimonadales bacterium]|nr:MAG: PDZ domain-containing protein [Gemmatimonadales bacterium]